MLTKKSNVVDISLQKILSLSYQDIFDGKWNIPLTLIQKSIIRAYVDLVVSTSNAYVDKEQLYVHLAKQSQIAPYLPNTEGFSGDLRCFCIVNILFIGIIFTVYIMMFCIVYLTLYLLIYL